MLLIALGGTQTLAMNQMAECRLTGALGGTISIHHIDNTKDLHFMGTVTNLAPGKHGFHVHEFGELTNQCKDAGGHFNPTKMNHGSLTSKERHAGDLENINANSDRTARVDITLRGSNLEDFIGKSIVVHERIDDLGLGGHEDSLKTGNAGSRLDCCTIRWRDLGNSAAVDAGGFVIVALTGVLSLFF